MRLLIGLALFVLVYLTFGFLHRVYGVITEPDKQCIFSHTTISKPPQKLENSLDYFEQGNYDYDTGNCKKAIVDYTKSLELDPTNSQVYNNRAYTYMRIQDYKDALPDLDKAISLRPDYVQALMNRGDIYNYYYNIDRQKAIADYDRVIALGIKKDLSKSVCGHKAMAKSNNVIPLAFLRVFTHVDCK